MSTDRQRSAARKNLEKAREIRSERARGEKIPRSPGLSSAQQDRLGDDQFAFPKERKEPLIDAKHVRNAVARFDQVEQVSDRERDEAWKRIKRAAQEFDIQIDADDWRELFVGGKEKKR